MSTDADIKELGTLLSLLRTHGIKSYRSENFEIHFADRAYLKEPMIDNTITPPASGENKAESHDEMLYWSTPFAGGGNKS